MPWSRGSIIWSITTSFVFGTAAFITMSSEFYFIVPCDIPEFTNRIFAKGYRQ